MNDNNIYDIKIGAGSKIQNGNLLEVYYKLAVDDYKYSSLKDIKLDVTKCLEHTYNPDIPIIIKYSKGEILDGLFNGMQGMKASGGDRRIRVPSHSAFGGRIWNKIPANTDLIIEISIAKILPHDHQ